MTTPDVSGYGRERSHARLRNSDATLSMPDLVRGWSSPMARSLTKPSHEDHAEGAVTNVNRGRGAPRNALARCRRLLLDLWRAGRGPAAGILEIIRIARGDNRREAAWRGRERPAASRG